MSYIYTSRKSRKIPSTVHLSIWQEEKIAINKRKVIQKVVLLIKQPKDKSCARHIF